MSPRQVSRRGRPTMPSDGPTRTTHFFRCGSGSAGGRFASGRNGRLQWSETVRTGCKRTSRQRDRQAEGAARVLRRIRNWLVAMRWAGSDQGEGSRGSAMRPGVGLPCQGLRAAQDSAGPSRRLAAGPRDRGRGAAVERSQEGTPRFADRSSRRENAVHADWETVETGLQAGRCRQGPAGARGSALLVHGKPDSRPAFSR